MSSTNDYRDEKTDHVIAAGIAAGGCSSGPIGGAVTGVFGPVSPAFPGGWVPPLPPHIAAEKYAPTSEPLHILERPLVTIEQVGKHQWNMEFLNMKTNEAQDVVKLLPEILNRFLSKNLDYRDFPEADLGPKAHFVGIWRKVGKLKQALWLGNHLEHEQVSEVIDDMIGHLLLARLGLQDRNDQKKN